MYQITRVINNNVVMAQNDRGEERILRGLVPDSMFPVPEGISVCHQYWKLCI